VIDARSDAAALPALERLERRVAWGLRNLQAARVSGVVVEVSMSHYRVAGLSRFLKLGECVSVDVGDRVQIGEVVRIDDASATLKPFDARCDAAIGARAYRTDNLSLSPDQTWKGRVIDALGRPLDGAGELVSGDKFVPLDADPPPALSRGRVHVSVRTGVRRRPLHATVPGAKGRRVCGIRGRQVLASCDARSGAAIRQCRDRARG
jgi:flagellum-specific ATP synthase